MPVQKKIDTVQKLTEKLETAKAVVLTDYRGLTHRELENLRCSLADVATDFTVVKNTLLTRVMATSRFPLPTSNFQLTGPTAVLIAHQDEVTPLKCLAKFIQVFKLPTIKLGFLFGKLATAEEVVRIASLPPKEVLLSQFTLLLKMPLTGLHYALSWNLRKLVYVLTAVRSSKS